MKKMFGKKKELTPEQQREMMEQNGLPVMHSSSRKSKFSQFSDHAQRLSNQKDAAGPTVGGVNPYAQAPSQPSGGNPYAAAQSQDPYARGGADPYSSGRAQDPYARSGSSRDPYAQGGAAGSQDPYSRGTQPRPGNGPRADSDAGSTAPPPSYRSNASPYAAAESSYGSRFGQPLQRTQTTETFDNRRNELFAGSAKANKANDENGGRSQAPLSADDELMETPEDINRGYTAPAPIPETAEMDSEDEDVEAIKGQIRFTKQESVNSTRNALRMAAEAEESGRNTLGMLGAQGERLANTERSIAMAEVQNRIAEDKARELRTLNRSMFAVHVSNPFNSKRRLQEKEDGIRAEHRRDQALRDDRRQMAYESSQRVSGGLQGKSETAKKYRTPASALERSKYQFEEDSEDDELENEIESNLDGISSAMGRLKRLAVSNNEEITRQNQRLDNIAESTDNLDVNVHLNTRRLADIR